MKKIIYILCLFAVSSFASDSTEIAELVAKAESGDAEAQYQLGVMYFYGKSVEQDFFEAEKWLHLAAEQNHVRAQYELGKLYYPEMESLRGFEQRYRRYRYGEKKNHDMPSGIYSKPDDTIVVYDTVRFYVDAEKWLLKAAESGLPEAQTALAWLYSRGFGRSGANHLDAIHWLEKAAKKDYTRAQWELGELFATPSGHMNMPKAYFWLKVSIDKIMNTGNQPMNM